MLKKITLLAMAIGALTAFAAPAAQAWDQWVTEGSGPVGGSTAAADIVEFTGELKTTKFPLTNGPCVVHAQVRVWNSTTATAEVIGFQITGPCDVQVHPNAVFPTAFCSLTANSSATEENPWHVNVGPNTEIDIENVKFTNFYSAGCQSIGIPAEASAEGTATGQAVNGENKACIVFEESGDLSNEVLIDGEVCANNLTLQ